MELIVIGAQGTWACRRFYFIACKDETHKNRASHGKTHRAPGARHTYTSVQLQGQWCHVVGTYFLRAPDGRSSCADREPRSEIADDAPVLVTNTSHDARSPCCTHGLSRAPRALARTTSVTRGMRTQQHQKVQRPRSTQVSLNSRDRTWGST